MSYRLHFVVEELPDLYNGTTGTHWGKKQKTAQRWHMIVYHHVIKHRKPMAPLKTAKLTLTRHSSVAPDSDSLCFSFKYVIDGLVHAKVLEDDKYANIGMPKYLWQKAPPKKGFIEIMVEETRDVAMDLVEIT